MTSGTDGPGRGAADAAHGAADAAHGGAGRAGGAADAAHGGAGGAADAAHGGAGGARGAGVPAGATARVVTVSDRAAAGVYADRSGPLAGSLLAEAGFAVGPVVVVPDDGPAIEAALRDAVADGVDLVVTSGGTGLGPRDVTPEATGRVVERPVPGIAEAIRADARDRVPTSVLSRGVAGLAGRTLVVNLPGSSGGVRDGVAVLLPLIGHAVDQLRGGDHPPVGRPGGRTGDGPGGVGGAAAG